MPFGFQALHDALGRVERLEETIVEVNVLPDVAAQMLADIKARFGVQGEGWPDLAPDTQQQRVRLGFAADEPLLRTGALRDAYTIWSDVGTHEVIIGVPPESDQAAVAEAQEFGTDTIPPRPVLGPVVMEKGHLLPDGIGRVVERAIKG